MGLSIIDIAKEAGVSKSTVSRAVNGGSVSEKSRQAVMNAIQKLGYSPNFMARGLRGVNSKIIGVLSSGGQIFSNPLLASHYTGMMDVFQQHGYDILLVHDDYNYQHGVLEPKVITYLKEKKIVGLVTIGSDDLPLVRQAAESFRNVVYDGPRIFENKGFRVGLDNYEFSKLVYEHLYLNNDRKVLTVISFDKSNLLLRRRRQAYCDVYGVGEEEAINSFLILNCNSLFSESQLCREVYNKFISDNFTSLYVDDIQLAKRIVEYFSQMDLNYHDDYSIIALERAGKEFVSQEDEITTLLIPIYEYGAALASLMIEVIENPSIVCKDVDMYYKLCVRKSVRKLT